MLAAYQDARTRLVLLIDPIEKSAIAYTLGGRTRFYHATDTLDGGKVLPGFTLPLAALFDR